MGGAFERATAVLFADRNQTVEALYRAAGEGPPLAIRVVERSPDVETSFSGSRLVSDTTVFLVPVAAVPALARGDTLEIGGNLWEVQSEPMRDGARLVWTVDALPVVEELPDGE